MHVVAPNAINGLGSTNEELVPSVDTSVAIDVPQHPVYIDDIIIAITVIIDVLVTIIVTDTDVIRLIGRRKNRLTLIIT